MTHRLLDRIDDWLDRNDARLGRLVYIGLAGTIAYFAIHAIVAVSRGSL